MKTFAILAIAVCCWSCASDEAAPSYAEAQSIVDGIVAKHPEVVRLTIHAVPSGKMESQVIASNIAAKLGKKSDPEDISAMATGETVVLKEGVNLDVTIAIKNAAGKAIAATGVTINPGADGDDAAKKKAMAVADEVAAAINASPKALW